MPHSSFRLVLAIAAVALASTPIYGTGKGSTSWSGGTQWAVSSRELLSAAGASLEAPHMGTTQVLGDGSEHDLFLVRGMRHASPPSGLVTQNAESKSDSDSDSARENAPRPHRVSALFSSSEHLVLAEDAVLSGFSDGSTSSSRQLPLGNGVSVTYGEIVYLAGDFFGDPDRPISTASDRASAFRSGFATLGSDRGASRVVSKVNALVSAELDVVKGSNPPSAAWSSGKLDKYDGKYNEATGGGSFINALFPLGTYLELAMDNFDHFWPNSRLAYETAHAAAMSAAAAAGKMAPGASRDAALARAYAMNAFGDHFLSDMFASGHMRTPRRKLQDRGAIGAIGDRLSQHMHDEENAYGLDVQDGLGHRWIAYGDHYLRDSKNADNRARVVAAVAASAGEVAASFSAKAPVSQSKMASYYPMVVQGSSRNKVPLFKLSPGGAVLRRTKTTDPNYNAFTSDWSPSKTLAILEANKLVNSAAAPLPPSLAAGARVPAAEEDAEVDITNAGDATTVTFNVWSVHRGSRLSRVDTLRDARIRVSCAGTVRGSGEVSGSVARVRIPAGAAFCKQGWRVHLQVQ